MLDFNSKTALAERMVSLIDKGIDASAKGERRRDYLGGSIVGEECERRIQYEYRGAPGSGEFEARTRRIFQRGHWGEDAQAEWIKAAGFNLRTHDKSGRQFGFTDCDDRFKGHIDGVIIEGPDGFAFPALWEAKTLGSKGWRALVKHGLKKQYPKYAAQVAVYQAYMKLAENPAIFTALNADTMEIHVVLVPFDAELAQSSIDKVARILTAEDAGETLPKISDDPEFFLCKFCPFREACWGGVA